MAETDRELLEMAAKAAGIGVDFECTQWGRYWAGEKVGFWNPLTDDGDALRLAVELGIWIHPDRHTQEAIGHRAVYERHDGNEPEAAMRRAIVRAAAAIGKGAKP